jgi:hypothetical protein
MDSQQRSGVDGRSNKAMAPDLEFSLLQLSVGQKQSSNEFEDSPCNAVRTPRTALAVAAYYKYAEQRRQLTSSVTDTI